MRFNLKIQDCQNWYHLTNHLLDASWNLPCFVLVAIYISLVGSTTLSSTKARFSHGCPRYPCCGDGSFWVKLLAPAFIVDNVSPRTPICFLELLSLALLLVQISSIMLLVHSHATVWSPKLREDHRLGNCPADLRACVPSSSLPLSVNGAARPIVVDSRKSVQVQLKDGYFG